LTHQKLSQMHGFLWRTSGRHEYVKYFFWSNVLLTAI